MNYISIHRHNLSQTKDTKLKLGCNFFKENENLRIAGYYSTKPAKCAAFYEYVGGVNLECWMKGGTTLLPMWIWGTCEAADCADDLQE